jgi:hypothetical protein
MTESEVVTNTDIFSASLCHGKYNSNTVREHREAFNEKSISLNQLDIVDKYDI